MESRYGKTLARETVQNDPLGTQSYPMSSLKDVALNIIDEELNTCLENMRNTASGDPNLYCIAMTIGQLQTIRIRFEKEL